MDRTSDVRKRGASAAADEEPFRVVFGSAAPAAESYRTNDVAQDRRHLQSVPELCEPPPKRPKKKRKTAKFFDKAMPQSIVKSEIVSKYFVPWAQIMMRETRFKQQKMVYIDLYAGKGKYDDGTPSTPIEIMQAILRDKNLASRMITLFADADGDCIDALRENISSLDGIENLRYAPQYSVGAADEHGIQEYYEHRSAPPTFMFLDPFGYKGISSKLMRSILKDFGCEIAFFFKYTRIRAALRNKLVREEMDAIFGSDRVEALAAELPLVSSQREKEQLILGALELALREIGAKYVLTFRFLSEAGHVTHHLVFVTKHHLAFDIMKDIMYGASTDKKDDIASFEFRVKSSSNNIEMLLPLFQSPARPIEALKADLVDRYRGRTLSIEQIYRDHNYGTPYVKRNYQEALRQLYYEDKKVSAKRGPLKPPLKENSRTLPFEDTFITFT